MSSIIIFFKTMTISKYLLLLISPILIIILSMQTILLALVIIIFIDLLTGIRKAHHKSNIKFRPWKKEFWKVVKSKALRSTWRKATEYGVGVIVFTLLDALVFKSSPLVEMGYNYSLSELAAIIACLVEVYSIYENMEAVSGNNPLKKILSFLPLKFKTFFAK